MKKLNFEVIATTYYKDKNVNLPVGRIVNIENYPEIIVDIDTYSFNGREILFISDYAEKEPFDYIYERVLQYSSCPKVVYFGDNQDFISKIGANLFNPFQFELLKNFNFYPNKPCSRFVSSVPVVFAVGIYESYEVDQITLVLKHSLEELGLKVVTYSNSNDMRIFGALPYSPSFMSATTGPFQQINELNEWFRYIDSTLEPDIVLCSIPHGPTFMQECLKSNKGVYLDLIKNILQPNFLITVLYDLSLDSSHFEVQKNQLESMLSIKSNKYYFSNSMFTGIPNNGSTMYPLYINEEIVKVNSCNFDEREIFTIDKSRVVAHELYQMFAK